MTSSWERALAGLEIPADQGRMERLGGNRGDTGREESLLFGTGMKNSSGYGQLRYRKLSKNE